MTINVYSRPIATKHHSILLRLFYSPILLESRLDEVEFVTKDVFVKKFLRARKNLRTKKAKNG